MNLTIKQRHVAQAMIWGAIFSLAYIATAYYFFPTQYSPTFELQSNMQFTIRCDLFALSMLLLGIGVVAKQRFFSSTAISGNTDKIDQTIIINLRYIQNTLEQTILLFITHLALATILPINSMKLIPILVSLFIIGRILFWVGYHRSPISRAFGFVTSFYPTAFAMIYCCFKITGV